MKSKSCLVGGAGSLVLALMAVSAQAAPLPEPGSALRAAAATSSPVDTISTRRCWREHGRRHCRSYGGPATYSYRSSGSDYSGRDYYEHDANSLRFGSQRWWEQMLRENRLNPGGGRN
jgi:hypothetical protein